MKIIHTADIHLDSPLLKTRNAKQRRFELLQALSNLNQYANNSGVSAIIVAGDLFDDQFTTDNTVFSVADIINDSKATWFVLRGNHGNGARGVIANPYEKLKGLCPNVKTFSDGWTSYALEGVTICGRELGAKDIEQWQQLLLPKDTFNILTLHGDVDDDSYGVIDKKAIAQSGANYVALGHRHAYAQHKFGKVLACYSGVLESRGFDENTQTGFVLLDTQTKTATFVPMAIRRVENVTVDVSSAQSDIALQNLLLQATSQVDARNYLNVTLTGWRCDQISLHNATNILADRFFALRVENKTQMAVDLDKLSQEISLRGEFVRKVLQLPKDEQAEVLQMGLTLLNGGDLQ